MKNKKLLWVVGAFIILDWVVVRMGNRSHEIKASMIRQESIYKIRSAK